MTFKEQLKENCYCHGHHQCHWCYIAIYSKDLEDMFLDKQQVKEAIKKTIQHVEPIGFLISPYQLAKELGIEREELGLDK